MPAANELFSEYMSNNDHGVNQNKKENWSKMIWQKIKQRKNVIKWTCQIKIRNKRQRLDNINIDTSDSYKRQK